MPTMRDVAKRAGVSLATVSRVINERGYLSKATIKSVHSAMQELDYYPNDLARSLHRQRSNILGIIIPLVAHPFFGEITTHVEYYAYQMGYKLLVCNSLEDRDKERDYITMLKRSQVDGIIVGSHTQSLEDYQSIRLPIVSLDRKLADNIPYVCCDNYAGGELATRHLVACGCKRLLHICGNLDVNMMSNQRTDAFIQVCNEAGVAYKVCQLTDNAIVNVKSDGGIPGIIEQHLDYDGIFATSDVSAAIAMRILVQMGLNVPNDVKVVGFDGIGISAMTSPQITTVQQPMEAIGRYAVECLHRQISGETVPTQAQLPVTLLHRGSTLMQI